MDMTKRENELENRPANGLNFIENPHFTMKPCLFWHKNDNLYLSLATML